MMNAMINLMRGTIQFLLLIVVLRWVVFLLFRKKFGFLNNAKMMNPRAYYEYKAMKYKARQRTIRHYKKLIIKLIKALIRLIGYLKTRIVELKAIKQETVVENSNVNVENLLDLQDYIREQVQRELDRKEKILQAEMNVDDILDEMNINPM